MPRAPRRKAAPSPPPKPPETAAEWIVRQARETPPPRGALLAAAASALWAAELVAGALGEAEAPEAARERERWEAIRGRLGALLRQPPVAERPEPAVALALKAYRGARRLLDASLEALVALPEALDVAGTRRLTALGAGGPLLAGAAEAASDLAFALAAGPIAEWVAPELPALAAQATLVAEWRARMAGALSWRLPGGAAAQG